jgi:hypothetical protein
LQFVAQYAKDNLFSMVLSNVNDNDEEHGEILTKQILEVDEQILQQTKKQDDLSGMWKFYLNPTELLLRIWNHL